MSDKLAFVRRIVDDDGLRKSCSDEPREVCSTFIEWIGAKQLDESLDDYLGDR